MKFQDFHENQEILQKRDPFSPAYKNTNETIGISMILGSNFLRNRTFRKKWIFSPNSAKFRENPQISLILVIFTNFWGFGGPWAPENCTFVKMTIFLKQKW